MATTAPGSTSDDQQSRPEHEARDDCAITRPSAEIPIPIFDNDGGGTPSSLRVSEVAGNLWFNAEGDAVYTAAEHSPKISFHYQSEYDGSVGDPAEVFVLVSGPEPLSKAVGDDLRLANACSEGRGLENSVLDTPGAPLPELGPGHHVTVVVDQLAGQKLELDDPGMHPWKAMTVDGGVDLFDPTGVIFLKGLTDNSDIQFELLDRRGKHAQAYSAEDLRIQGGARPEAGGESSQPNQPAEVADNRLVIYHAALGETHVDPFAKTEFPRCGEPKCLVYAYNGQAYVVPESSHVEGQLPWPEDLRFADAFGWSWGIGQAFGPGLMLAANSDDAGAGTAAPTALGAYWTEHDPTASVVVIDHFFEHVGGPNSTGALNRPEPVRDSRRPLESAAAGRAARFRGVRNRLPDSGERLPPQDRARHWRRAWRRRRLYSV